jgi:hypothetical protein
MCVCFVCEKVRKGEKSIHNKNTFRQSRINNRNAKGIKGERGFLKTKIEKNLFFNFWKIKNKHNKVIIKKKLTAKIDRNLTRSRSLAHLSPRSLRSCWSSSIVLVKLEKQNELFGNKRTRNLENKS